MVKSKSAYVIKKKYTLDISPTQEDTEDPTKETAKKRVEFDCSASKMPREPISVPNFSILTLPTPVLTPVEAAKLVYLDSEDENEILGKDQPQNSKNSESEDENPALKRGDSYSSHLGYADNPLYQQMVNNLEENSRENVSSTSDYASIETVNRLSSTSSYSVKTQEENRKNREKDVKNGPFGFCNPNYVGVDIKASLAENKDDKEAAARTLANHKEEETVEDALELQTFTRVYYRRSARPPKTLEVEKRTSFRENSPSATLNRSRAVSAGRRGSGADPGSALYVYVVGGKEQGQVTVFRRPISIWRLQLF